MSKDPWSLDELDLDGYLKRVGLTTQPPSLVALGELHEAHVRTFTFDNIDVILDQHPGVSLEAVQEKFVGRGRGGYCFEHSTLFAAVLERLGYRVRRQLGRVVEARTHMTVGVLLGDRWWLCDPGFGMSVIRPIPMEDGRVVDHYGWRSKIVRLPDLPGWELYRQHDGDWAQLHTIDELRVEPVDPEVAHHYTYTHPGSLFRSRLMIARYLPDEHVTVTESTVTIRRAGRPTKQRDLKHGELTHWLRVLQVPLTFDEQERLVARAAELA